MEQDDFIEKEKEFPTKLYSFFEISFYMLFNEPYNTKTPISLNQQKQKFNCLS